LRERGFADRRRPFDDADHCPAFALRRKGPKGLP
jgi:hypothetical protein